jgi:hypothetical protein
MKASFADFEEKFGGKVFVVFSFDGEIANKEVIKDIQVFVAYSVSLPFQSRSTFERSMR